MAILEIVKIIKNVKVDKLTQRKAKNAGVAEKNITVHMIFLRYVPKCR